MVPAMLSVLLWLQSQPVTPAGKFSISGRVTEKTTGQPVPGVFVSVYTEGVKAVSTDADGRYTVTNVPAGTHMVNVQLRGLVSWNQLRQVTVAGFAVENFNFHVTAPAAITGRVLNAEKEGVPGASVTVYVEEMQGGSPQRIPVAFVKTDKDGTYTTRGLEGERTYFVAAQTLSPKLAAIAETPAKPTDRKPVARGAWYPNSPLAVGRHPCLPEPRRSWKESILKWVPPRSAALPARYPMQRKPSICTLNPWSNRLSV